MEEKGEQVKGEKRERKKSESWPILKNYIFSKSSCHIIYLLKFIFKFIRFIN